MRLVKVSCFGRPLRPSKSLTMTLDEARRAAERLHGLESNGWRAQGLKGYHASWRGPGRCARRSRPRLRVCRCAPSRRPSPPPRLDPGLAREPPLLHPECRPNAGTLRPARARRGFRLQTDHCRCLAVAGSRPGRSICTSAIRTDEDHGVFEVNVDGSDALEALDAQACEHGDPPRRSYPVWLPPARTRIRMHGCIKWLQAARSGPRRQAAGPWPAPP